MNNENYPDDVSSDKTRIIQAIKIDSEQNKELKHGRAGMNTPPFKTAIRK